MALKNYYGFNAWKFVKDQDLGQDLGKVWYLKQNAKNVWKRVYKIAVTDFDN